MPELTEAQEITQIKTEMETRSEFKVLPREEVSQVVEKYDKEFVGKGAECVVFSERDESRKSKYLGLGKKPFKDNVVVAVDYSMVLDPNRAKEIFYTHRIMSTLFPFNFPRFATSFGSSDKVEGVSGTVRQKIDIVEEGGKGAHNLDVGSPHPFETVERVVDKLGLPLNLDKSGFNFGKDKHGNVYFLDKLRLKEAGSSWSEKDTVWDLDAIGDYMDKNKYSDLDKRIITKSINRLNDFKNQRNI